MKTIKIMSVVGICLFALSFFLVSYYIDYDNDAAIGWGVIAILYGLAFSIATLSISKK